jgi:hypothetical protein
LDQPLSFEKREQNFGSTFFKGGFLKVGQFTISDKEV